MFVQKIVSSLFLVIGISIVGNAQLPDLKKGVSKITGNKGAGLSEEEVGRGLKEALTKGIEKGVSQLSLKDGYFKDVQIKLLMPDDAKTIESKLRQVGQGKLVDDAIESMNRAAEDAANQAKDIFIGAINNLTLKDVMNILNGSEDAATNFLKSQTRAQLFEKFKPVIKASLDKVGATKNWTTLINAYNKLPLVKKMNPDLVEYATNKAIDGLFIQIAKEEAEIRKNPAARVSDLLKKVFS